MSPQIRCSSCQQLFTPKRSDATTCSVRCRVAAWRRSRHYVTAEQHEARPAAHSSKPTAEPEDLDGWRRVGRYLIPPPDSRYTAFIDPADEFRRSR